MSIFSKRLREQREVLGFSQTKLASAVKLHQSIIGRYERDEAKPTIDVVSRIALVLGTSVGYLLGETEQAHLFKDKKMLERFQEIVDLPEKEKDCLLMTIDHFIKAAKINLL